MECHRIGRVEALGAPGGSALHVAAARGDRTAVETILTAASAEIGGGSIVNINDPRGIDGATALHCAARWGHTSVVRLLASFGADLSALTRGNGFTALHVAAMHGHADIVEKLLALDADPNALTKDRKAKTPLHVAADKGHKAVVAQLIAAGADVNRIRIDDASTPLHMAAWSGHTDVVGLLLGASANVDAARSTNGSTPLHLSAMLGHDRVVKQLLAGGSNVDVARQHNGTTALHLASANCHVEVVDLLLDAGCNVNAMRYDDSSTPLMCAIEMLRSEIIKRLVTHGADVNAARSTNGHTPLHEAARLDKKWIAEWLLAANADLTKLNKNGKRPSQMCAAGDGTGPLLRYMERNYASSTDLERIAVLRLHGIGRSLLDAGLIKCPIAHPRTGSVPLDVLAERVGKMAGPMSLHRTVLLMREVEGRAAILRRSIVAMLIIENRLSGRGRGKRCPQGGALQSGDGSKHAVLDGSGAVTDAGDAGVRYLGDISAIKHRTDNVGHLAVLPGELVRVIIEKMIQNWWPVRPRIMRDSKRSRSEDGSDEDCSEGASSSEDKSSYHRRARVDRHSQ